MKHPRTAALTGGIASGKSTVARMFRDLGAHIIDADRVARQVVEPGRPAWKEVVEHFGQALLLEDGRIDRKKLGAIVFNQTEERQILEQIIHPRVIDDINRQEHQVRNAEHDRVIVVDVPLLIEASMQTNYVTIVVVYVSEEVQLERLMARDSLPEQVARQRIAAQMPLDEKLRYATHIIQNNGTYQQTQQQVMTVYQHIRNT